ncbi:hypothetical protein CYJ10_12530 [Cupriavidus pauculus]|uniref:Phage head morphogenesis domain-containing protein n=2 Tax=Cupriavidus pauculus TaxID=82633 RepID=A0A2N5CE47_9BURK|nr:hypothetical protein CYJ10_12530 [Cupriavidus pauculus]
MFPRLLDALRYLYGRLFDPDRPAGKASATGTSPVAAPSRRDRRRQRMESKAAQAKIQAFLTSVNLRRGLNEKQRQKNDGVVAYRWRTAGDRYVCEYCAANDGKVFQWDDPPPLTGHPASGCCCANGVCRCTAEPMPGETRRDLAG